MLQPRAKGGPRLPARRSRKRPGRSPAGASGGAGPWDTVIFTSSLQNSERINACRPKPSGLWHCYSSPKSSNTEPFPKDQLMSRTYSQTLAHINTEQRTDWAVRCHWQTPRSGSGKVPPGVGGSRERTAPAPPSASSSVRHTELADRCLYGQTQHHTTARRWLASGYKTNQYQIQN